jgi:hypothetical protein
LRQHVAAGLGQRGVQRQVVAAQLDGAGHAQLVAQAAHGDLHFVVDGGDVGASSGLIGKVAL